MGQLVERRKDKRFQVTHSAHAVLGPHLRKVGQITDISRGGLAFRYIGCQDSSELCELDVLSARCCSVKLPFKTICDFEIANQFVLGSIPVRRRGVRFGDLTHDQKSELSRFIQDYTTGDTEGW
jgi:hypothetical protein